MAGQGQSVAELSAEEISEVALEARDFTMYYGDFAAVKNVSMKFPKHDVTALIGPSGCGKSTFLRSLNRMNDIIPGARTEGSIILNGKDIYDPSVDVVELRRQIGMVWQRPNPFEKSIFDNVAYGPKYQGVRNKKKLQEIVEESLRKAALWDEVKDRLHQSALALSGGQQQRLCIARSIAIKPDILLLDEPTSALDPISTMKIEELIGELKQEYTIIIVTHNMQQAARISSYTAFFLMGNLIEFDATNKLFVHPSKQETSDYIAGRFG